MSQPDPTAEGGGGQEKILELLGCCKGRDTVCHEFQRLEDSVLSCFYLLLNNVTSLKSVFLY